MPQIRIKNRQQLQSSNNLQFKWVGESFADLENQLNTALQKLGISAGSTSAAPPNIDAVTVSAANGVADLAITDNGSIFRALQYFAEYSTDPAFSVASTHLVPMKESRNVRIPVFLGAAPVYFRAYSQYLDGPASSPVNFGAPTGVATGGAGPALGAGQLAGTATATGQGRGDDLARNNNGVDATL